MNILGLADGPRPSAALYKDGVLVSVRTEVRGLGLDRFGIPWEAAEAVLHDGGLSPADVDHVAVAGKYTPMLLLRQHPRLRRLGGDAFSPARDLHAMAQAFLRQSGLGALESDRAAEWWTQQLKSRGYGQRRLQLVTIHRALAAAGYRCQVDDDVLVVSMHPMGDGVVAAIHRGEAGFLELVWEQRGSSALQVHLTRCAEVLGFAGTADMYELSELAARGNADAEIVRELEGWLRVREGQIEGHRRPLPGMRRDKVYTLLDNASRADAAASLMVNLHGAVCKLVSWHLRAEAIQDVVLCGSLLHDPRLVNAVAALPSVGTVTALPLTGGAELAVGAAASLGGVAPRPLPILGLSRPFSDSDAKAAIAASSCKPVKRRSPAKWLSDQLADGKSVARLQDRAGLGRWGAGRSAALVAADDAVAIERLRKNLGRSPDEQPGCLFVDTVMDGRSTHAETLHRASLHGVAAMSFGEAFSRRIPGVVSKDGRIYAIRVSAETDPVLHDALTRLRAKTGCPGVACFPLAAGDLPSATGTEDAVRVFVTSGLDGLQLGPFGVVNPA
ncbi:MAG: putative NodU family carbamoyl transferase [Myxococcota bacterium]